jgi:hypothetical protein
MQMKLKSELMSNVLAILLWALVGLSALDLIGTIIYVVDLNFFMDYAYSLNGFVNIISIGLYYIILVIYLIWIYRVHMDLNALFPSYPRSPGSSLACMMVPFYNFYGIPSTYNLIGAHYRREATGVEKQGWIITWLAAPLIIFFIATNFLSKYANRTNEPNTTVLLVLAVCSLILYSIFLILCINVSRGLKNVQLKESTIIITSE